MTNDECSFQGVLQHFIAVCYLYALYECPPIMTIALSSNLLQVGKQLVRLTPQCDGMNERRTHHSVGLVYKVEVLVASWPQSDSPIVL